MKKSDNIIIVGGNAAGPAAAAKAKRINPSANVILFEASEFISTGTCELPYLLAGEIKDYNTLIFFDEKSFKDSKGVQVFSKHFVQNINTKSKEIVVKDLKTEKVLSFKYDKLILTTGSIPNPVPNLTSQYENVFYFKTISDYLRINSFIKKNKVSSVAIIGAGYIGLETSEACRNLNLDVNLFEKTSDPFPEAETEIRFLIKKQLEKNNVRFFGNATNLIFNKTNNRILSINCEGRIIDCGLIIVCAGVLPNNTLALQSKLELTAKGAIKVDKRLKSSDPNIYAAGDNIEVVNFITNKTQYLPFATYARDSGYVAGENAAGGNAFFEPVINNIAIKLFDNFYTSVGLSSEDCKKNNFRFKSVSAIEPNLVKVMPDSSNVFGKILLDPDTGRVWGASFYGKREVEGLANVISIIIKTRQSAKLLSNINFNYTPPLSPFKNILSVLGSKIIKNEFDN